MASPGAPNDGVEAAGIAPAAEPTNEETLLLSSEQTMGCRAQLCGLEAKLIRMDQERNGQGSRAESSWKDVFRRFLQTTDPDLHYALRSFCGCSAFEAHGEAHGERILDVFIRLASDAQWRKWLTISVKVAARSANLSIFDQLLAVCPRDSGFWTQATSWSLFVAAAEGGNFHIFSSLRRVCPSVSELWTHHTGFLLASAARGGNLEIFSDVYALYRSDSEFWTEITTWEFMQIAAQGGNVEILSTLLARCPSAEVWTRENAFKLLCGAVLGGSFQMFSHVLAIDGFPSFFGAQLDRGHCRKLLVSAAVGGSLDILLALLEVDGLLPIVREVGGPHSRPFSALYFAAANGRRSCVKALIEAGAALEYKCLKQGHLGKTALSVAVHTGHEEVVRELLAAGASVSNTGASVMIPEQNLLSVATSRNREGIIDDLVAAGADVGKDREECPPLHVAAKEGFCRPLERLLLAGAKVDCVDRVGRSALHIACFYNREGAVEVLLRHHASTSLLCDESLSPFDMVAVDALETRQGRAMGTAMGTAMGRAMGRASRTPCTLNTVETSVADRICGMLRNASKWGRRGWLVMMRARHLDATQVLGTSMSLLSLSTRRWKDGKNESLHDGLATEDTDHDCALGGQCSEQRVPTAPDNPVQAGDAIDGGQARDIRCRGAVVWLLHRPDQSGVFREILSFL